MENIVKLDKIAINVKSHHLLKELLKENPILEEIMRNARNETEALVGVKNWILDASQKEKMLINSIRVKQGQRSI